MLNVNEIANLILTVSFVATFIGVFFFTYGAGVEKEIVIKQVDYITQDLTSLLNTNLAPEYKSLLRSAFSKLDPPNMDAVDDEVKRNNAELMKQAFMVLGGVFTAGILLTYYLSSRYHLDFKSLLIKNSIMLVFIAIVEYVFLKYFATQFISADPNYVKTIIINTLKEYSGK